MARLPRIAVPGYPHHLIQRGNNRQIIFRDADDFRRMLDLLAEQARRERVAIHSYVLMDNHLHLLATPETENGLSRLMQAVGRSYVRHYNRRHARTGGLWEGRYKATLVQTDRYLLACMAYIDLNPVRAGMAVKAGDYRWSSYAHYAGLHHDPLVAPHALYWALGNTPFAREAAYSELVAQGLRQEERNRITESTLHGWALADPARLQALQRLTARRLKPAQVGRPRSVTKPSK